VVVLRLSTTGAANLPYTALLHVSSACPRACLRSVTYSGGHSAPAGTALVEHGSGWSKPPEYIVFPRTRAVMRGGVDPGRRTYTWQRPLPLPRASEAHMAMHCSATLGLAMPRANPLLYLSLFASLLTWLSHEYPFRPFQQRSSKGQSQRFEGFNLISSLLSEGKPSSASFPRGMPTSI